MVNVEQLESLELKISKFLRFGVIVAGTFLVVGWVMSFTMSPNVFYVFQDYDRIPFVELFRHYLRRKEWGPIVSYAGLIILISLPILRVLLTMVMFIKLKERPLALIAGLVLLGLLVSFSFGIEL